VTNSHGRFAWYELITTELEAAAAFYTKVMGWSAIDVSVAGRAYTLFTAGKASVSGMMDLSEDARKIGGKPSWIGYVGVDDVDAAADRIKHLGGVVHVPPTDVPNISRYSIFTDPQTARLALFKWLRPGQEQPAEPGALGRVGWHELLAADWERRWLSTASFLVGKKRTLTSGRWGRISCSPLRGRRSAACSLSRRLCRSPSGFIISA